MYSRMANHLRLKVLHVCSTNNCAVRVNIITDQLMQACRQILQSRSYSKSTKSLISKSCSINRVPRINGVYFGTCGFARVMSQSYVPALCSQSQHFSTLMRDCSQKRNEILQNAFVKTAELDSIGSIRSVGRSSRNNDEENKSTLSSLKLNKIQDKTRQNIKRRVSKIKARVIHHNRFLQEKLLLQRVQGSIVVKKLRKKLQVKKENIKTIPNLLTTLRMASAPVLAYLVVNEHFNVALSVFLVAGVTDMLDGYIARNFKNQKTALGTALDPLADKLLISFLTVSLTSASLIPVPMTVLILSRDAGLILASFYIRYISLAPPRTLSRYFDVSHVTAKLYPSNISKANTALQLLYVACTLASPVLDCVGHPLLQGLMYVTATTTFLSGADYAFTWRRRLKIIKNN